MQYESMGVGVVLSEALQKLGVNSSVLASAAHPFGFKEDYIFPAHMRFTRGLFRRFEWRKFYDFDILHSHDNRPLPSYVMRRWEGALIQHYHDPKTKGHLYGNDVPSFVSVPNILKVIPDATWIPFPVDTTLFSQERRVQHDGIHIGYCDQQTDPSKRRYIPKDEVEIAIKNSRGKASPYPLTDIIPHSEMPEYYGRIDLWVDRLGLDFYGFSAAEVAAMGIPVITQIGEDEVLFTQSCPFINVDKKGLAGAIVSLVEDEQLRKSLGERARDYALKVHDSINVAKLCLDKYMEMKANN